MNKTIEINARYYLLGHDGSYDVLDRALEFQMLPAMVFANGTEEECRDWVLRNTKEPQEHVQRQTWIHEDRIIYVLNETIGGLMNRWSVSIQAGFTENGERPSADELDGILRLMATSPALLALLEQYHKSFPTKESGKLIAQAKGWI